MLESLKPRMPVLDALQTIVGDKGEVVLQYGGFRITVRQHARFPWYDLFNFLVGESFQVWIDRIDGSLVIVAKQRLD